MSEQPSGNQYPMPVSCNELTQRDQRALIFHLLYAVDTLDYDTSLESVAENISREHGYIILSHDNVFLTASAIIANRANLDLQIEPLLANWRFDRLGLVTKLIMRFALWELQRPETPPLVVINEAVELAKCFAEANAYRFVNGVLDEWAKKYLPADALIATVEESTIPSSLDNEA